MRESVHSFRINGLIIPHQRLLDLGGGKQRLHDFEINSNNFTS